MAKELTTTNKDIYIPFGGANIDLGDEAVSPAPEFPLLQYATGLPAQRPKLDDKGQQVIDPETGEALFDNLYYAGFFTVKGRDKDLDAAMQDKGVHWIDISHGSGEIVRHWMLERVTVFLLAAGIPSNANSNGELGMVYQWRNKRQSTKSETVLHAQVVLRSLLPDYSKPFVFTMKSTQTTDALNAMRRQYKVLGRAHEELQRHGKDLTLPLWSYSAIFGASKKQELRGKEGASKPIFPMISGIPDEIPLSYLKKHECALDYIDHFRECTEKAIEWAEALSQRIASGIESHEPWKSNGSDAAEDAPF